MKRIVKYKTILQARSTSTRLPGKSMMKICGIPLALLCAKRLSSNSINNSLVVATSVDKSDNYLSKILTKNNFKVFRGSLTDVISRFYLISKEMHEDDVIIRATADNPIPDNKLILNLKNLYEKKKIKYMCFRSPENKLPYGLSLEFIKVDLIRKVFFKNSKTI